MDARQMAATADKKVSGGDGKGALQDATVAMCERLEKRVAELEETNRDLIAILREFMKAVHPQIHSSLKHPCLKITGRYCGACDHANERRKILKAGEIYRGPACCLFIPDLPFGREAVAYAHKAENPQFVPSICNTPINEISLIKTLNFVPLMPSEPK
jgi:hypothetical protein